MMFVHRKQNCIFRWAGVSMLGGFLAFAGTSAAARAQSSDLPSNPSPNPSSLSNPYYGSVTLKPATDGVVRLSLDEAVQRGLSTNLGLKEAEQNEKGLHGQEIEALQYFLPSITVTGATGYN